MKYKKIEKEDKNINYFKSAPNNKEKNWLFFYRSPNKINSLYCLSGKFVVDTESWREYKKKIRNINFLLLITWKVILKIRVNKFIYKR